MFISHLMSMIFIKVKMSHSRLIVSLSSHSTGDESERVMSEVQGTLEFSVELHKFHNVDLFQRG